MGVCRTPKKGDIIKVQPLTLNVKIVKNCISDRIINLRLPVYDSIIVLKFNAAIVAHVLLFNENVLTSRLSPLGINPRHLDEISESMNQA